MYALATLKYPRSAIAFSTRSWISSTVGMNAVFFIVVLVGALLAMKALRGGFLVSVPPFDALLMALATFRITRLVVYDKITRWFRELFVKRRVYEKDGKMWVEITPHGGGFFHTIYDLLQCPWCIGFWAALIVVFCYFVGFHLGVVGDPLFSACRHRHTLPALG
jgi:hypothetical protein